MPDQGPVDYLYIPHTFVVTSASIAGGGSTITPLLLDQDADFELHEIFAQAFGGTVADGATDIRPNNFTFQIADKSNGRNWSDAPVPQAVAARLPGGLVMKRPVLLARRSNLAITFANLSASQAVICVLSFIGHKVLAYRR